jgi:hypothetical protein
MKAFLVSICLILLGIFLMIAAYSRKPLLLKLASLGMFRIDPDSPGRVPRLIMFSIGVGLTVVGLALVVIDKLHELGVF